LNRDDAATLHHALAGAGTVVTLVLPQSAGPGGSSALVDGLARRHSVLTFDPRGTGRSGPAPAELSMPSMAHDLLGLLDTLGIARTHLLCHSTGCGVGQSLAAKHPERVTSLVLAAPWTHADGHLRTMQTLRKAAARALDAEQYERFNAALLFPPGFRRGDEAGFARLASAAAARPVDADAFARRLDAILEFDARPLWTAIGCPTLVSVARDDQLMPPWHARDTAEGIAGARLFELDGGGHMLPETQTAAFLALVLPFLAQADRDHAPANG